MGGTTRLALGLGVMALGVLGALPFRRAPQAGKNELARQTAHQATLGDGVALQVPGQRTAIESQASQLEPMPPVEEPEEPQRREADKPAFRAAWPPPRLPDEYYPLFPAEKRDQNGQGRVISANNQTRPPRQKTKRHTIHDGDTLPLLAERYLDDPERADEILLANRSVLTDPEVLPIGVEIIIPPRNQASPRAEAADLPNVEIRKLVPLPAIGFERDHSP